MILYFTEILFFKVIISLTIQQNVLKAKKNYKDVKESEGLINVSLLREEFKCPIFPSFLEK